MMKSFLCRLRILCVHQVTVVIPEDALGMAAVGALSILENMALGDVRRYARHRGLAMDWAAARADLPDDRTDRAAGCGNHQGLAGLPHQGIPHEAEERLSEISRA